MLSGEGTRFGIQKRGASFQSHKFNNSSLVYEVALSIKHSVMYWAIDPFPAGTLDIAFVCGGLMTKLEESECCKAGDGYDGEYPCHIKCPGGM